MRPAKAAPGLYTMRGELKLALKVKALERELKRLKRIVEEGQEAYDDLLEEAEEELEEDET